MNQPVREKLLTEGLCQFDKDNHPFESNEDVLSFLEDVETTRLMCARSLG